MRKQTCVQVVIPLGTMSASSILSFSESASKGGLACTGGSCALGNLVEKTGFVAKFLTKSMSCEHTLGNGHNCFTEYILRRLSGQAAYRFCYRSFLTHRAADERSTMQYNAC